MLLPRELVRALQLSIRPQPRAGVLCPMNWQFVAGTRHASVDMPAIEPNCQSVVHGQRRYGVGGCRRRAPEPRISP